MTTTNVSTTKWYCACSGKWCEFANLQGFCTLTACCKRLKSCPFCGGEAEMIETLFYDYIVECEICGASTSYCDSEEMAVEAWNRRKESK